MKQEQKILLQLIRSALGDKKMPESLKKLSIEERKKVMYYAKKQELFPFLQYFDCFAKGESRDYFFKNISAGIAADARQEKEKKILLETFEKNKIDCIPLKGCVTKEMYPMTELRTMGDLDILYKIEQTNTLRKVMKELGYEYQGEASKHDHYKKSGIVVEMHKELLPVDSIAYSYFEEIWIRAKKEEGKSYIWSMTLEDHYIFSLCHLLEHFIRGGIGIRMVLDIYILSHQAGLNKEYILKQLQMMGLDKFEEKIRNLAEIWFGEDKEENKKQKENYAELAEYIIDGGTFGKAENEKQNNTLRYRSCFEYLIKQTFPSYKVMKSVFSWLNTPLLLPVAWIYRFWKVLTERRKNISIQLRRTVQMEKQNSGGISQREVFFKKCGLGEIIFRR